MSWAGLLHNNCYNRQHPYGCVWGALHSSARADHDAEQAGDFQDLVALPGGACHSAACPVHGVIGISSDFLLL